MLEKFINQDSKEPASWGSKVEIEVRRRIKLAAAAYAYEYENESIISDAEYDKESLLVNPKLATGNSRLDCFFRDNFNPDTGQWIRKHPDLPRIKKIYNDYYKR